MPRHSSRPHLGPPEAGAEVEGEDFARVDWWGAELDGVTFTRCRFDDAGLEELVTRRCVFDQCVLTGVRMGGSRHLGSAFLSCRFDRAKLIRRHLGRLQAHRLAVPGRPAAADDRDRVRLELRRRCAVPTSPALDLSGQRFREADLTDADLRGTDLTGADLDRVRLQGAKLRGADLRARPRTRSTGAPSS